MVFTKREKDIVRLLSKGTPVREIAKSLKIADSSVSGSIARIRLKIYEIEEDIDFLEDVGLLIGKLKFVSMDPKSLVRTK